jgi:hypothetical protein
MPTDFPFFKGDAIAAEEVERRTHRKYQWQQILDAIKPGTAQQVDIKFDSVRNAILKLESEGKIPIGDYYARTRGRAGEKRVTFIVRKSRP